jgi:hypothetical protein
MPLMRRIRSDEKGTSLVLVALSLVVLLGFGAIAIDGAAAWALKRQDQNAADTGVLAGALQTSGVDKATAIQNATDEIMRITYINVNPDMDMAAWKAEWASCVDTNKPARFTEPGLSSDVGLGAIDCISFTDNLQDFRVITPVIPWDTTFGKVIGFDQIDTRAEAEVHVEFDIPGGVLPFGMPGGQTNVEVCLKTGPNPNGVEPCDGPDQGNFGFLDFTQFGNDDFNTTKTCTGGGTSKIAGNIAQGIDHGLGTWDTHPSAGVIANHDVAACNDGNFQAYPYQVDVETGNMSQVLDDGLADGVSGLDGKLELTTGQSQLKVRGTDLDNTPLWHYLTPNFKAACEHPSTGVAVGPDFKLDSATEMEDCLGTWTTGDGVIFIQDIENAPRFGWVPVLWEDFGPGTTTMTIRAIIPIYIQKTFWQCNATGCDLIWDPGEISTPQPGGGRIEASTAFAIPTDADFVPLSLPTLIRESAPGTQGQVRLLLSK